MMRKDIETQRHVVHKAPHPGLRSKLQTLTTALKATLRALPLLILILGFAWPKETTAVTLYLAQAQGGLWVRMLVLLAVILEWRILARMGISACRYIIAAYDGMLVQPMSKSVHTFQHTEPGTIDGVAVTEIAREIAATGTSGVTDLKALGINARNAMKVRTALLTSTYSLHDPLDPVRITSMEPVAYKDTENGNLATLSPALMDAKADVRARMVESVLMRELLKESTTAPIITGQPTDHGKAYKAIAIPFS